MLELMTHGTSLWLAFIVFLVSTPVLCVRCMLDKPIGMLGKIALASWCYVFVVFYFDLPGRNAASQQGISYEDYLEKQEEERAERQEEERRQDLERQAEEKGSANHRFAAGLIATLCRRA